jgi:hypothetical protein
MQMSTYMYPPLELSTWHLALVSKYSFTQIPERGCSADVRSKPEDLNGS